MKVTVAQSAGFCMGVKNAVDRAQKLAQQGFNVFTDGPLIHNKELMKSLESKGIKVTDTPEKLSKDDTLIIRAHGITPKRRKFLMGIGCKLSDATCPDVARIQGIIKKYTNKGYSIVIFGDKGHAEVIGLEGYAGEHGTVVQNINDVKNLNLKEPVCLVSQSTQPISIFMDIATELKNRFNKVEIINTICNATKNRQHDLEFLANNTDMIIVVGDQNSANTRRLFELASKLTRTEYIQTADQLKKEMFKNIKHVGLTAGASTPDFIINEIKKTLEAM